MSSLYNQNKVTDNGFIPLSVPKIDGNEWKYVKDCLDTGWISSVGSYVSLFEEEFTKKLGSKFSIATVNGTSALHVALMVAGVHPDEEVLISSLTFIAPVNTIRYIGAWPVFIDADHLYWQMDPLDIRRFLTQECEQRDGATWNRITGRKVSAIIPVHILGHPCEMDEILDLAREFNLVVIEDATESLGALYRNKKVGTLGDIACFSFNGNKVISNGGGGMIVTDNHEWATKARYLTTQAKDDPKEFIHNEIGYNYRMTNVLAAIGLAQLEKLDDYIQKKRQITGRYEEELKNIQGLSFMPESGHVFSTKWLNTMLVDPFYFGRTSRGVIRILAEKNIEARPLWQPIHLSPAYRTYNPRNCPTAKRLNDLAVSIPSSVGLTDKEQTKVIQVILNTKM